MHQERGVLNTQKNLLFIVLELEIANCKVDVKNENAICIYDHCRIKKNNKYSINGSVFR